MAAASWTPCPPRFMPCPKSSKPWAAKPKFWSMAAFAAAATSSKPYASAPARFSLAAPTSTVSPPPASPASPAPSKSSAKMCSAPCACSAAPPSPRSTLPTSSKNNFPKVLAKKKWRSGFPRHAGCTAWAVLPLFFSAHRSRGCFGLHRGDVIHDALRPSVDVRPPVPVADPVLVRRHVHHVRPRRPRGENSVVRLLIGNHDQPRKLPPLPLLVELLQRALEVRPRVRLRTHDGVPQRNPAPRRQLHTSVRESRRGKILGLLAKQNRQSRGRVHARGLALLRERAVHRTGYVHNQSGRSRQLLESGDALEHGLLDGVLELRRVPCRRHEPERQRPHHAFVEPLTH